MNTKSKTVNKALSGDELEKIAQELVSARREARAIDHYPGAIPNDLATAYAIQDIAIDQWDDELAGWKVGRIPPARESEFGCDRLAGPVFRSALYRQSGDSMTEVPVFAGGFAAVEAEFVAMLAADAPSDKCDWSRDESAAMIGDLRIGLEVASSPFSQINELGPAVTASDFGNNNGLIVGSAITEWRSLDPKTLRCTAYVDGEPVGDGGVALLTGGVVRSVQFILELAARRGLPLRAGDAIATGQTTGIHKVEPGQMARIDFPTFGSLSCRLIEASAV